MPLRPLRKARLDVIEKNAERHGVSRQDVESAVERIGAKSSLICCGPLKAHGANGLSLSGPAEFGASSIGGGDHGDAVCVRLCALRFFAVVLAGTASAQQLATLRVTVTDQSGGVIPQARVTVRSLDTDAKRTELSIGDRRRGDYRGCPRATMS